MSAIKDLEAKVNQLESQLMDAETKLRKAKLAAASVQVGDVVVSRRWGLVRVTRVDVSWDTPWVRGNPKKKDGTFGKVERALYSDWELVK